MGCCYSMWKCSIARLSPSSQKQNNNTKDTDPRRIFELPRRRQKEGVQKNLVPENGCKLNLSVIISDERNT